jgi:N-acetylneuraminate lyase
MTNQLLLLFGPVLLSASFAVAEETVAPLRVTGLITAVFTPYHSNGTVNLDAVPSLAEFQKKMGAKGVFVGGTTGDSVSLSLAERKALAEAWAPAAKKNGLLFIVHVGAEALADATELTRHAQSLGADAVGCMPSVFFKPANVNALALWLQKVGQAAPKIPLYYYHIPSMTGVLFPMIDLLKAVEQVGVPNFAGVKYTGLYESDAFPDLERCQRYKEGRYEVFCGREEMTLEALSIGVHGFIGSQFNFVADLYGAVAKAWPNATRGQEIQELGLDLITIWKQVPSGVNGNRMVMDFTPVHAGPARLPNLQPDAATVKEFGASIRAWCTRADRVIGHSIELCKSAPTPPGPSPPTSMGQIKWQHGQRC